MRRSPQHSAAPEEPAWADARSSQRSAIHKHAILNSHNRAQTVVIRDISTGGMKVQNAFGLIEGDVVTIELLTRRALTGKVAWSVPPYCGIKFDTELAASDPLLAAPSR